MTESPILFGTELRRRRLAAGLSLTDLSRRVHYSKSHLSKVETGAKPASSDLARQCDAVLACDGELARLVPPPDAHTSAVFDDETSEVWIVKLDDVGGDSFATVSRRSLLLGGAATMAAALAATGPRPVRKAMAPAAAGEAEATIASFRAIFDNLRQLGQWMSPGLLIPQLATQVFALRSVAAQQRSTQRDEALVLAARFAEYAGWLTQEDGDDDRAKWWTDQAVTLASAGGDADMAAYSLVRRGLIALYQDDAGATVELAVAAGAATENPRIRGLAAQREAQGYALAGDYSACMRAIERADRWLSRSDRTTGPVIGTSNVTDVVAMATGWCLVDLGRPAQAAEILRRELAAVPADALRTQARFGTRLALALANGGEAEAACAAIEPVLDSLGSIGSATIRTDLRQLARVLNRWHAVASIRDTRLRLTDSLSIGGPRI